MGKRVSSRDLGQRLVAAAREAGIEVRTVTITPTPKFERVHREVVKYLEAVRKFEEESRKNAPNILVGGDNCGYCRRAREMQGRKY